MKLTPQLRAEYERFLASCTIRPERSTAAHRLVDRIAANRGRYEAVQAATGVPWWFVALIHAMESGLRLDAHLHNGDPLTARTVRVPAGRPRAGSPPFTWEESAADALTTEPHDLRGWPDWTAAGALYQAERWNGWGYRRRGEPSDYLWAGSYHDEPGRYVGDGRWDPTGVSQQIGVGVLLRLLAGRGLVEFDGTPRCSAISPSDYPCVRELGHELEHRDELGLAWDEGAAA